MKTLVVAAGSLCAVLSAGADSVRAGNFANPPSDMRLLPCLNGWSEKAIGWADAAGFGGAACSCAWTKNYLRDEGDWKGFASFARQANRSGLSLWLYDEYGYPSGTAGFEALEGHPELQARGALIAYADVKSGEEATVAFPPGNRLGAAAIPLEDGKVVTARQRELPVGEGANLVWRAPDGSGMWRVCAYAEDAVYTGTHSQVSLVLKAPYINMLDPRATRRFIACTHERYAAHFDKDEFARIFRSTFTDEPALTQWVRPMPYLNLPWAHDLPDEYKALTGRDIIRDLPSIAFEVADPQDLASRWAYRHIVGERVRKNYFGQIADWCRAHGIWSGGHLFAEEAIAAHGGLYGDFFGCLRALTAPGIDCLCPYPKRIDPLPALYAMSAADLNGEGAPVMCEFSDYGRGTNAPPTQAETVGNAFKLVAAGVTEFTNYHRLQTFGSDAEKRKFNEMVGRAIALVKGTSGAADVAILYPCDAIQAAFLPAKNGCGGVENFAIDRDLKATAKSLYTASRPFMFADADSIQKARIENGSLVFGKNRWRAVVLPRAMVLPVAVAEKLAAFKEAGGCVVATGARPANAPTEYPSVRVTDFGKSVELVDCAATAEAIARQVPSPVRLIGGASPVRVLHRRAADGDVFFLYNDSENPWSGEVVFADGRTTAELWRPAEGDHRTVAAKGGRFAVKIRGYAAVALTAPEPARLSGSIELFNGRDLTGWYKYLKDRGRDNDPRGVLSVTNGVIRITGEEWGALVSEKEYSDYRLTVEYRWLGTRFGIKKDWALDSGILFHSVGPDGGFEGIWMASHECNLIQGATGDFWTVHPKGSSMFLEAEVGDRLLMGKYRIWEKGGAKVRLTGNDRICRFDIDPTWTDTPAAPLAVNEHPVGEWNKVVLECRGATVDVWFNGKLVNRATRVEPARGRIQLQSEGCGVEFRRVTLERLDECQHVPCSPPRVVAVPPTFAARDMCVLDDGEIRHYGWQSVGGTPCRVYASTRDFGESWTTRIAAENDVGAMVKSPYGGDWIYWRMKGGGGMEFLRSKVGPGDICAERVDYPWSRLELRQLLAMKSRRRWVAAFSDVTCASNECYHATVALSDDDGWSWRRVDLKPVAGVARMAPGDKRPHWFNNGCEPSVVELKDGTLLLAVRTSGPHAAFYRSKDGGETWSEGTPDPSFWQANTMPYLFRLRDGRLLFVWNNTQMLPTRDASEYPELDAATLRGEWESVFTNRDALHAAISEDDGKTWKGFREVILNPIRNASDFRQLGNDPLQEHDKSVHQTQAIELPDGKVLLSLGQNIAARRLVIIDPEWLYETGREEDFRHGLENLSTHLYVKSLTGGWRGFAGHCAWNRAPGAMLVRDPDTGSETQREVLQLCRISDPRLVSDRQGIVWNFPAARRGRFETECRIDGEGFRFVLTDHWINPCDETNPQMSPVAVDITADRIGGGEWHRLVCEWDEDRGVFTVACGNFRLEGRMTAVPKFGLSYAHLQTLSEFCNPKGAYFRSFSMSAVQDNDDTRRK